MEEHVNLARKKRMDPATVAAVSVSVLSVVGTLVLGVIQLLKGGYTCPESTCCSIFKTQHNVQNDVHDNDNVTLKQ